MALKQSSKKKLITKFQTHKTDTGSPQVQIGILTKEIDEIKEVKDKIAALLARKQVIEALQTDRVQTVYLLDELVRQMPEGVFLKSVKQRGSGIELVGYAQSNARVSTLMRNIESSPWLSSRMARCSSAAISRQSTMWRSRTWRA